LAGRAGRMDTAFIRDGNGKRLVDACVEGDASARRQFLAEFMPLIYRFEGGGSQHESASQNFIDFLFDDDRLYRRLRSYRGVAHLGPYLGKRILPDLMKQFRTIIRRQRFDTVSLDVGEASAAVAKSCEHVDADDAPPVNVTLLVEQLPVEKRLLLKLLYIEDFDLDPTEIQQLASRTGRSIRDVIARVETARQAVRSREAVQHARLEAAESSGQWIRLYTRRLAQLEEDIAAVDADSRRAARLRSQGEDLLRKLDKRKRQQAEHLQSSSNTVVTLPTAMVADLLGQRESTTRSQITRVRQELAASLPKESRLRGENP
jgi:DNA-directed RNA polymerase specialized sigma24 family protein